MSNNNLWCKTCKSHHHPVDYCSVDKNEAKPVEGAKRVKQPDEDIVKRAEMVYLKKILRLSEVTDNVNAISILCQEIRDQERKKVALLKTRVEKLEKALDQIWMATEVNGNDNCCICGKVARIKSQEALEGVKEQE